MALTSVVERFVSQAIQEADSSKKSTDSVIKERLSHFEEMTGGYAFSQVIAKYWEGHETDNEQLKSSAIQWLRGEFSVKTDSRKALDVRTIVNDSNVYDYLKLMSAFVVAAGYKGLLIGLDEMVNIYKLSSKKARESNYEQILRILNDVLQGTATNLGFFVWWNP